MWCALITTIAALFTAPLIVAGLTGWKGMALAICIIGVLALYGFNRVFSNPFEFLCIVCLWFGAYPAAGCIEVV